MRSDMAKVLVERPRPGSRSGSRPRKGYRKEVDKALQGVDGGPAKEGMLRRYGWKRHFNEHLSPLRRYLDRNTGRPWNKVYSEICQFVDRGNVVQKHILTHLFEYVVRETIIIDGVPCLGKHDWRHQYGIPLRDFRTSRDTWYVCPVSGLLKKFAKEKRHRYVYQPTPRVKPLVRVNETLMYRIVPKGIELVRVEPLPEMWPTKTGQDVVLNRSWSSLTKVDALYTYGRLVYATDRWLASKKELLQLPIPYDVIQRKAR